MDQLERADSEYMSWDGMGWDEMKMGWEVTYSGNALRRYEIPLFNFT